MFIIDKLVERCTRLKGDRHLKGEFSFCNELYILNRIFDQQGLPAQVLEEVVDIDQQFEAYQNNRLQILRPQLLYRTGPLNLRTQLLRITREEHLSVTTEPRNLKIISRDSLNKVRLSGKTLAHIGMIVISVKGLARKKLGTKVLIAILDKRWKSDARKAMPRHIDHDIEYAYQLL